MVKKIFLLATASRSVIGPRQLERGVFPAGKASGNHEKPTITSSVENKEEVDN
jgi:hypothetical protein